MAGEFNLTLDQLVEQFLPTGFSVSQAFKDRSVIVWQLYLWKAFPDLTEQTRFTLGEYPEEALPLFAALIVHDALNIALTDNFLNSMGSAGSTAGAEADGNIKSIKTGPAEVEFHDGTSSLSKLIYATRNGGGILAEMQEKACMFAGQLGVALPFCPKRKTPTLPIKGGITLPDISKRILRKS